jgi:hypothetical protein
MRTIPLGARYDPPLPAGRVVPGNYSQGRAIGEDRVLWVQFPRQQFHSAPAAATLRDNFDSCLKGPFGVLVVTVKELIISSESEIGLVQDIAVSFSSVPAYSVELVPPLAFISIGHHSK